MKRMRIFISLLAAAALLAGVFAMPAAAAPAADTNAFAAEVLRLVNAERKKAGLAELAPGTAALNNAAKKRAQEIVTKFDHKRPDGRSCFTVLEEYGVASVARGENIASGYSKPADVMAAWMNSSGHKANILGNFSRLGVGVYERNGRLYWVQLFIREGSAPNTPTPKWKTWSPVAQWLAKVFLFGWIWMK